MEGFLRRLIRQNSRSFLVLIPFFYGFNFFTVGFFNAFKKHQSTLQQQSV